MAPEAEPTLPSSCRPVRCPCGSGERYADCCGSLHRGRGSGEPTAPTAERLMRSRFSAFAVGDAEYLLATWHPTTRPAELELEPSMEWRQLEIRDTTGGGEADRDGTVEFVAYSWDATSHEHGRSHEHSAFVREAGQWFYLGPVA